MADIHHDFPVSATPGRVFTAITSPEGLDAWWTLESDGHPRAGAEYRFYFGPGWDWKARVIRCEADRHIEWEFTDADEDWTGTRLTFELESTAGGTHVRFHHARWMEANDHFRRSSFCWAMYLRLLRRYIHFGETVAYANRFEA